MKQRIALVALSLLCCAGILAGCSVSPASPSPDSNTQQPVATPLPVQATPTATPTEDPAVPDAVPLALPDTYTISYQVTDAGNGFNYALDTGDFSMDLHMGGGDAERVYTQTLIKAENGYALELGDTGERYCFLRLDSGKYLMYRYDQNTETYVCDAWSDSVRQQIDAGVMTLDMIAVNESVVNGFSSRITSYFEFYDQSQDWLQYLNMETVDGVACLHYSGSIAGSEGTQTAEVWVDEETGLCRKGTHSFTDANGNRRTRTILCKSYTPGEASLPKVDGSIP